MRFETHKRDVLFLIGDDGVVLASYCSEDGYHAMVEGLDPDLKGDMLEHLANWGGTKDGEYEMSE